MKKKKIIITGIAGFIGFHTALKLKKRGDEIIGIDNFNNYYSPKLKKMRSALLEAEGIKVLHIDLNEQSKIKELVTEFGATHILHLAAQAGVRYSKEHPEAYIKSNIDGFLSILEILRHFVHVKLIYASSSSVYGLNEELPFSEGDKTDKPANLYAATKKANELMAYSYHHLYGIESTGLRFFTVYGPWGRPDMAYYSFTEALMKGAPIFLFNEGKMRRDFTYIDDIVMGTIAAIDLGSGSEIFNLGNHQPVEVLEFIRTLERLLGKKGNIILKGEAPGEVPSTFASIEHAQKRLNYFPKTSLEEGLGHFTHWYLSHLSKLNE